MSNSKQSPDLGTRMSLAEMQEVIALPDKPLSHFVAFDAWLSLKANQKLPGGGSAAIPAERIARLQSMPSQWPMPASGLQHRLDAARATVRSACAKVVALRGPRAPAGFLRPPADQPRSLATRSEA